MQATRPRCKARSQPKAAEREWPGNRVSAVHKRAVLCQKRTAEPAQSPVPLSGQTVPHQWCTRLPIRDALATAAL